MIKNKIFHPFLLVLEFFTIVALSCTPESCLEETVASVNAVFYRTGTGKEQAPDSLTIYGIGNEQVKIYNKAGNINVARIQLNPSAEISTFYMKVNDITDTISFSYSSYPHLISKECGFAVYHTISEVSDRANEIDVLLTNGNITTTNEENIRIFY